MLLVKNINSFYGKIHALWDVSLEIHGGEIVVLVGANGAGKTTLLKTISGILRPASGRVEFLGKRIDGQPVPDIVEEGVSHIPEGGRLFPDMTVRENLEMGGYLVDRADAMVRCLERVFELFPVLQDRSRQVAGTLSGGEQQMLAIGRALMSSPKLIMFDEPSLGLAPKLVATIFEMVVRINREMGATALLVEQNVAHSCEISRRGFVIENGEVVLEGAGQSLLSNEHVKKAYLGL